MPKKKFFTVDASQLCDGYEVVVNPYLPASLQDDYPFGQWIWNATRVCCAFAPIDDPCFGFNVASDIEVCTQKDANNRCTNSFLTGMGLSWHPAHPHYFPATTDPRLAYTTDEYGHYDTNCYSAAPSNAQLLSGCETNYADVDGGWTVWNGRGEKMPECNYNDLLAWSGTANPAWLFKWQQFYHHMILFGTPTVSPDSKYIGSTPSDFPCVAAGPVTYNSTTRRCERTYYFDPYGMEWFMSGVLQDLPADGNWTGSCAGNNPNPAYTVNQTRLVPGGTCNGLSPIPTSYQIVLPVGCPVSYGKVVNGGTAAYGGFDPGPDTTGSTAWDEFPLPAPLPVSFWQVASCSARLRSGVTVHDVTLKVDRKLWQDWDQFLCPDGFGVNYLPILDETYDYQCREPFVDHGCAYGYEADPDNPGACRPQCQDALCPDGGFFATEYDGYPLTPAEGGFCVIPYEEYLHTATMLGWARGTGGQLFLDGLTVYDHSSPEKMLYVRSMPGVIFLRGSVIDSWELETRGDAPDEYTVLRHMWTPNEGVDGLPEAPDPDTPDPDEDYLFGGITEGDELTEEWSDFLTSKGTQWIRQTTLDLLDENDDPLMYEAWVSVYHPKGHQYVFALWRNDNWYCRTATLADAEDNASWEISDEHLIAAGDPSVANIQLGRSGGIEFVFYTPAGDGVLLTCNDLKDGEGTWE
jgi:hypothetical protein